MRNGIILFICLLLAFHIPENINAEKAKVIWTTSATGNSNENSYSIRTDSEGNIFVNGSSTSYDLKFVPTSLINDNYASFFLAKYNNTGTLLWARNGSSGSQSAAVGLTTDLSGNSYISGSFKSGNIKFGSYTLTNSWAGVYGKMYVAKFNSNGDVVWAATPTNTDLSSGMYGLATDKSGNLFTTGHFQDNSFTYGNVTVTNSAAPNQDIFLVKFDPAGKALWGKNIGGSNHDVGKALTIDKSGNVIVAGTFKSPSFPLGGKTITNAAAGETDILITKFDTNGSFLWSKNFGGTAEDNVNSVCTDNDGNIYFCGYTRNTSLKFDSFTLPKNYLAGSQCFLVKLSANGNVIWVHTVDLINNNINATDSYNEVFNSVMCDTNGNVVVAGSTANSIISFNKITLNNISTYGTDAIIIKFSTNGDAIWGRNFGNNGDDTGQGCAVDNNNNYYLSGQYKSAKVNFDSTSVTNTYSTQGTSDAFLSKLIVIPDTIKIFYCTSSNSVKLSAPNNYSKYEWYNESNLLLGNDSTLLINNPTIGSKYFCKITVTPDNLVTLVTEIKNYKLDADFNFNISNCILNKVKFINKSTSEILPLSYKWVFSDGSISNEANPEHTFVNPGKYKVTLSVSNILSLCPDTISKVISVYSPMKVFITGDSLCCAGYTTTLKASGAESYLWSDGNQTDSIVVNENSGKIWVMGIYGNGACTSEKVYKTITKGNPVISLAGYKTYCPAKSTTLKCIGAKHFKWSTGELKDSIVISSPGGNYWVVGLSAGGCVSDTLFFSVNEEPDWDFYIVGQTEFCKKDSTTIYALGSNTYEWDNGSKNDHMIIKQAGNYTVKAMNIRGCGKSLSFTVTENDLPKCIFEVSSTELNNKQSILNCKTVPEENTEYEWNFGDGSTATGASVSHSYHIDNSVNEYIVSLKAKNIKRCTNTTSLSIDVVPYVPNVFTPNNDGKNDLFLPNLEILIIDRMGIEIYSGKEGWNGKYNGVPVPSDTYFYYLRFLDKNGQIRTKKGYVTLIR